MYNAQRYTGYRHRWCPEKLNWQKPFLVMTQIKYRHSAFSFNDSNAVIDDDPYKRCAFIQATIMGCGC